MNDAPLKNKPTQSKLGPRRILLVLLHSVRRRYIENELILEIGEHNDNESCDAAEGESVGPEAAVLQLPRARADVGGARAGGGSAGGEMAEDEGLFQLLSEERIEGRIRV